MFFLDDYLYKFQKKNGLEVEQPYVKYAILIVGTVLAVGIITYLFRKFITFIIAKNSRLIKVDPTNFIFLKNSISFLTYSAGLLWIFYNIPYFRSLGTALFAGASVFAAIAGFASQKALSNIIGGLFVLIFKPFRVGDVIEISNSRKGIIEEITLRHTIIRDYEHRRVVIPNSIISEETIVNSSITDQRIRKRIDFGISYESNVDVAIDIIKRVIEAHPLFIDNRTQEEIENGEPAVLVKLVALADFSVNLRAYVWANDNADSFTLSCDVLKSVKDEFDKQGIEIPYPHRTIVYKKQVTNE